MAQAKPANPQQRKVPDVDFLPWWSVFPIIGGIALLVAVGRHHPNVISGCVVVTALLVFELADRWQGRRRQAAGAIAGVVLLYVHAATIHVSGRYWWAWVALSVMLVPYAAWRVGGGVGTRTREVAKIASSLPNVMKASSPRFKDGTPIVKLGKVAADKFGNVNATYTVRDPGWNGNAYAALIAHDMTVAAPLVTDADLSGTVAQGLHRLTVRAFPAFANDAPEFPDKKTWTGREPIGWDANGEIVWLNPLTSDAQGELVGGTTGAGKSNYMRLRALTKWSLDWEVWAVDGSGGSLGLAPFCKEYHEDDRKALPMVDKAYAEMVRRRALVKAGSIYDGPGILVIIDECDSVMSNNGPALAHAIKEIAQQGRKTKVNLILGLQSAYVASVGGKEGGKVLNNLPMRVAFRCSSEIQGRQILGVTRDDYRPDKIDRTNRGECIVKGMPHADWERMRTWEVTDLPDTPTRDEGAPGAAPGDAVRSTQGEWVEVQGAGAGAGAPDPYLDPIEDGRPAKDKIRDLLSDMPRSAGWFGQTAGCARQVADRHLKTLANEGHARLREGQGWVRTKASLPVDDD